MKKYLIFAIVLIFLIVGFVRPAHADITNGLVGWWKLDEVSGTSAADSSGNGSVGILQNGPSWATGKIGQALNFDGIDDFVEIPFGDWLNVNNITVSLWVKKLSNSQPGWNTLISRQYDTSWDDVFFMAYNTSGGDNYIFGLNGDERSITGPASSPDLNQWAQLVGVYDGSYLTFYRNGVLIGSISVFPGMKSDTTKLTIGAQYNGYYSGAGRDVGIDEFANVIIDDVRIYNRALSAAEIQAIYSNSFGNIIVNATLDGQPWPSSGTSVINYTLSGPSGNISNSSAPFTYSGVIADSIYTLSYVSGGPAGAILDSAQPISPISSQFLPSGASVAFNINFVSPSSCGNGVIDTGEDCDVGPSSNLVAWYKFDDGSGAIATDSSGNGNIGILQNGPSWATGKIGGALFFDGANDYVGTLFSVSESLSGPGATFSAWVYPTTCTGSGHKMIVGQDNGDMGYDWAIALDTCWWDIAAGKPYPNWVVAPLNKWSHIAGVFDTATQKAILYIDGVQANNREDAVLYDTGSHDLINIGRNPLGTQYFNGKIDDVRIYDRALSAAEIGNLSSQGLGGETCQSRGFGEGTLSCEPATCSFNESQCLSSGADLIGRTLGINGDLVPGQSITFSINALNQSNNNASGPSTLRICIDNANCATSAAGSLGEFLIPALGENENSTLFTSNTWSMDTGAHTYYACADVYGTNAETNEANNCGSQAFTATECSDENDNSDPEDTLADFGSDPGCADIYDDNETDSNEFSLNASGPIIATIVGGGLSNSTKTTITVTPDVGFSGDVKLTLDSGQPSGTMPIFTDKDAGPLDLDLREDYITPAEYSVGSFFKVRVPQNTSYGTYNLSIKGKSGSKERYVTVPFRVEVRGPGYFEVLREPFKFFSLFEPIDLLGFMSSI